MPENTAAPSPPKPTSTKPTTNGCAIPRNPIPPTECKWDSGLKPMVMRDATEIEKRCDFQNSVGAENVVIPNPGSDLGVGNRQTVIDKASCAIPAQRLLISQQTFLPAKASHRPERSFIAGGVVFDEDMPRECDLIIDRIVPAQLSAEARIRNRTPERPDPRYRNRRPRGRPCAELVASRECRRRIPTVPEPRCRR